MATEDIADQYFIYENRLASFQGPQPVAKRRGSNAHSRAPKSLQWPHKNLAVADLAKAGFYFHPLPSNPDNVVCFLCQKALDGWEEDDNPLAEHLTHSPECGWAITAAIEVEYGGYAKEDPREPLMIEARKATFAGRWPYEGKRGWKCQTKQLVEAGWKYTPTMDSDDNTTCTYCQLALDGWEAGDKPMDEHYKRSPNCPFFGLINSNPAPKKAGRSKTARSSKASRLSIQSVATALSDITSVADLPADVDDSILTTTSTMTQGGKKTKGRKPAASKGRKTRAKKDEAVEIHEDEPVEETEKPQLQAKSTRGRKRTSDEVDQPVLTNAEAPAPKRRNTKARGSNAVDTSVLTVDTQHDVEMADAPAPAKKAAGRKKAPATKGRPRKASAASVASTASTASLRSKMPDDDELDRQLQADLDRPLTDDEDILADSDSERRNAQLVGKMKGKKGTTSKTIKQSQTESADYAMFDPAPAEPDDAAVDAELKMLEAEMAVEEEVETLKVPKKGRKAGTRKASKQTKKAKVVPPSEPDELEEPAPVPLPTRRSNGAENHDVSTVSTDTAVKKKRGRPSKKSTGSQAETEQVFEQPPPSVADNANTATSVDVEVESATIRESFSAMKGTPAKIERKPVSSQPPTRAEKALPAPPQSQSHLLPPPPATPRANHISPAHSAKQATVSPSPSPQASDAENQPPSSKPTTSANSKRVALAPMGVAATPVRNGSPSKRQNVIGGLQSTTPWAAVDLDLVFEDKENAAGATADRFFSKGGDLTSPEKRMTVEEWIYYNAGQAEQKLKHECEAMVTAFEKEGTRAMQALEGLVVD